MFTRRTATVIISAPDAWWAWTITAGDEYLPVPTISRDVNVLSAIVNVSTASPTDKIHDLDRIALLNDDAIEGIAFEHDEIVLHRDAPRVDLQLREQCAHRERLAQLELIAVQGDGQREGQIRPIV